MVVGIVNRTILRSRDQRGDIRLNATAFLAFASGAVNHVSISLVGQFYLSELFVLLAAAIVVLRGGARSIAKSRLFWTLIIASWVTLLGYMLSDLYIGTAPAQYLRGWGRIAILIMDVASVMILSFQSRQNLWWFVLGMGLGGFAYSIIHGIPFTMWKGGDGYGRSAIVTLVALLAFAPRRTWPVALLLFGVLNMALDFRSNGGIIIAVAAFAWASMKTPGKRVASMILPGIVASIVLVAAVIYTQIGHQQHRLSSDIGRTSAIIVSIKAIAQSPFIGYGSWTVNQELADELRKEIQTKQRETKEDVDFGFMGAGAGFQSHSQLIQSWIEGGVLGAAFFLLYGYRLVIFLSWCVLQRPADRLTPLFLYVLVNALWALVMSPFLGFVRIEIAVAAGVMLVLELERRALVAVADQGERPCPHGKILVQHDLFTWQDVREF